MHNSLIKEQIKEIKLFLLDMDGTVYLGEKLIPGALDFLEKVRARGKEYIFLTNNSSKDTAAYLKKLEMFGISADEKSVITSTDLLVYHLNRIKTGAKLFPVGTTLFEETLTAAGFNLIKTFERHNNPDYVVVAFDTSLYYEKLFFACSYIRKGVPYIATHPDYNCPLEDGVYMPDCGAIIEFIKASTGVLPLEIVGKPNTTVVKMIMERGFKKKELAMVGDRLYTDIRLGRDSGIKSILVLSGESDMEDVNQGDIKPDFIFESIRELGACL